MRSSSFDREDPPTPAHLERVAKRPPLSETPDVGGERFLFLGGLHKSGTSVLHRLLRAHPETSGFSDTGFPQDEGQMIQSVYPPAWMHGGPGKFAFHPDAHITERSHLVSDASRHQLLREWGAYHDLNCRIFLEKSPPNITKSRFLQALLPGSRFVFIVRHPAPVSYATKKWAQTSIRDLLLHWDAAHRILLGDLDLIEHAMVVRYEDLVAGPASCLADILEFSGLTAFALSEEVSDHSSKYFAEWESEKEGVLADLKRTGQSDLASMSRFGYRLSEPYVTPIEGGGSHW